MRDVNEIIDQFISEMKYLENDHVLGAFFYGSYYSGCADQFSDVDLHIILDDSDLSHYIEGCKCIDGIKISYTERPLKIDYALTINNFKQQSAFSNNIYTKSKILFDKHGDLKKLREFVKEKYSNMLPSADYTDILSSISSIYRDIDRMKRSCFCKRPDFLCSFFWAIEKIKRLYFKLNNIDAAAVYNRFYRCITEPNYNKERVNLASLDEKFKSMYLKLIEDDRSNNEEKLKNLIEFFDYVKKDVNFDEKDNRITINI